MIWFWVIATFILYGLALWQRSIIRRYQKIVAQQEALLKTSIALTDVAIAQTDAVIAGSRSSHSPPPPASGPVH